MNPVSLEEIVDLVWKNKRVPERAVAVMMDDGYRDNYLYGFPIFKRYGVPATIFLATGYVDTDGIFWWDRIGEILKRTRSSRLETQAVKANMNGAGASLPKVMDVRSWNQKNDAWRALTRILRWCEETQIERVVQVLEEQLDVNAAAYRHRHATLTWKQVVEMSESGIEFGAHTVTHRPLSTLQADEMVREVVISKRMIEDRIGKRVVSLAYPYGDDPGVESRLRGAMADHGFQCAFLSDEGYVSATSDPFALKRIAIGGSSIGVAVQGLMSVLRKGGG